MNKMRYKEIPCDALCVPVLIVDGYVKKAKHGTMIVKEVDVYHATRTYECVDCGRKKCVVTRIKI